MKMNPLPPQAYTKDTLLKAYSWLQNQSDSIKELATTPDILVSLFTKAQMNGASSLERPSIQNFKTELKSLAGLLGEFEQKPSEHKSSNEAAQNSQQPSFNPTYQSNLPSSLSLNTNQSLDLDAKTLSLIKEIAQECNLSSEKEALRLLISIGYKKLKNI